MIPKRTSTVLLVIDVMIIVVRAVRATGNTSLYDIFNQAISKTFGVLSSLQSSAVLGILRAFDQYGDGDMNKLAYIFATAWHEANLIPDRKEIRCRPGSTCYNQQELYWYTGFYGRGLSQLTHEYNYKAMGEIFRIDLVNNPDLALTPNISAQILVYGMMNGSFTSAPLGRYINGSKADFVNARRVVNGLDKASEIAEYATNIASNVKLLTQPV